ncbi:MAG: ATP-dependent chaperone ClpB [Bacillota bacterium]
MRLDKLTVKAQEAIQSAQSLAEEMQHQQLMPEHLLAALLEQPEGVAGKILAGLEVSPSKLAGDLRRYLDRQPKVQGAMDVYASQAFRQVLDEAWKEAVNMKDEYLSTEHLLLGIVSKAGGEAGRLLNQNKVTKDKILQALQGIRGSQRVTDPNPENKYEALLRFGHDLTEQARLGKLDPVIGRDEEINRVIQVLSRRTKNNPVLIGQPGVGKTAIVEGLAQRMVEGTVPETLKDKRLITLDIGVMVAGAKYRGEFEDRLKAVLKEVKDAHGNIVMFIDEIHTLVGAGAAEGAVDAANMLKPALARGELRCIGATTLNEYRKHIEKDAALERRFQQVYVGEPSVEDTIGILRGLKEKYEVHHGVRLKDSALIAAATLSHRYLTERFLPDKAIDLIDEAASRLRIEIDSMPGDIDAIVRKLRQLEVQAEALKKEKDPGSKEQLELINSQIANYKKELSAKKAHWNQEKEIIDKIRRVKEEIDASRVAEARAEREMDLNELARIRYGVLPGLEKDLEEANKQLKNLQQTSRMLKEEVDEEDIAEIVSKWTGIPVSRMLQGEVQKLLKMEELLKQRVVGQDQAVEVVANAIRRSRAGVSDPNRPLGSFIFLGPTGVGKTELAKALAHFLFNDERAMLRFDMSEYMEKHTVSRLIGAPPGYVGYDQGGQLTEAVRRRPYSVILFDEIEKAHGDVFNVLLQLLDDGRLTDGQGQTVNFRNTVVIMTSNLGSQYFTRLKDKDDLQEKVTEELKGHFRPEFLNRIDEVVIFNQLAKEHIIDIVDIQAKQLADRLEKMGYKLELPQEAKSLLAEKGYDPVYGARPLKRLIQKLVENPLSMAILEGKYKQGDTIMVGVDDKGEIAI